MSTCVHACCGKDTSNLVGCASGTPATSPTSLQTACSRRKSGERMKPTIGMPSNTVTTAPATCVPRSPNWRRLSRRGSRCAIANEPVEHAGRAENDEQEGKRNRAAHQPEGKRGLTVSSLKPPPEAGARNPDEGER